jgi:hypothetical protein
MYHNKIIISLFFVATIILPGVAVSDSAESIVVRRVLRPVMDNFVLYDQKPTGKSVGRYSYRAAWDVYEYKQRENYYRRTAEEENRRDEFSNLRRAADRQRVQEQEEMNDLERRLRESEYRLESASRRHPNDPELKQYDEAKLLRERIARDEERLKELGEN